MATHIVIDGYNLIKQSPVLSKLDRMDIEKGRDELINRLAAYKKVKKHRVTLVFDGCKGGRMQEERTKHKGISIIFSKKGEEADDVIKRIAMAMGEKMIVVSSDREIVAFCDGQGAATIPSSEFEMKIEMTAFSDSTGFDDTDDDESIKQTNYTKKKGPSRRLKRSHRRSNRKIEKL